MQLVTIKSFFAIVIVLFCVTNTTYSQTDEILMPYLKGELYGYANMNGEIVIEPIYKKASLFENGYAVVGLNNLAGILKQNGEYVLEPIAKRISRFDSNGLAVVNIDDQFGVINEEGEYVAPLHYSWVEIKSRFIQVSDASRKSALLDLKGKMIVDFKFDQFMLHEESVIDSNLIITRLGQEYGLIEILNNTYEERITAKYKSLRALTHQFFEAKENDKRGLVNSKGEVILPFEYDDLVEKDGFIITSQEIPYEVKIKIIELEGYRYQRSRDDIEKEFDDANRIVYYSMTQEEYDRVKSYGEEIRPDIRELYSLLDNQGQVIVPAQFGEISVNKHMIQVKTDDGVTLFDKKGTRISSLVFDQVDEVQEGLILVKVQSDEAAIKDLEKELEEGKTVPFFKQFKFGFIDATGKVILPLEYNAACAFNLDRAPVRKGDKWALINKKGMLLTDYKYDLLYFAGDNRYAFLIGKRWGLLDLEGREIIPATYYGIRAVDFEIFHFGGYSGLVFENGKAKTAKQLPGFDYKSVTLIDTNGVQLFPFKYSSIEEQEGGLFKVSAGREREGRGAYGLIDKDGNVLVPANQSNIWWLEREQVYVITKNGSSNNYSYCAKTGKKIESPYKIIEREGLREYKLVDNGCYSAKYNQFTVYFTPDGVPLFEE